MRGWFADRIVDIVIEPAVRLCKWLVPDKVEATKTYPDGTKEVF